MYFWPLFHSWGHRFRPRGVFFVFMVPMGNISDTSIFCDISDNLGLILMPKFFKSVFVALFHSWGYKFRPRGFFFGFTVHSANILDTSNFCDIYAVLGQFKAAFPINWIITFVSLLRPTIWTVFFLFFFQGTYEQYDLRYNKFCWHLGQFRADFMVKIL